jgi:hypothetical protein
MSLRTYLVAAFSLCLIASTAARADVLYIQPFDPAGGFYRSSHWDPDDSDYDHYVWDAFRLDQNAVITEIHWRGCFDPSFLGMGGPIRNFRIAIHTSTAWDTQPNVVDPPMLDFFAGGNANETPVGPVGGVQMYEYWIALPTPFRATRNRKYWVQIEGQQWGIPDWALAKGTGGDGGHFRAIAGSTLVQSPSLTYQMMSGDTAFSLHGTPAAVPRLAPVDFDGDSRSDISIFRPADGEWWWQRSSDSVVAAAQFGTAADNIVAADYTGDGSTDLAFWRPSNGNWFILRSEDSSFYAFPFGMAGDIPMPADYDGNGLADPAVFRPSSSDWYINLSSGTAIIHFGADADLPVAGDYDGDGKADVAIYRTSGVTHTEWWIQGSTAGLYAFPFGSPGDRAVPGEYTGDGRADVALYRPTSGQWFILRSEYPYSYYAFPFGAVGDMPAPADYDGDGRTDPGVFRPSTATWFVNRSTSGMLITGFGLPADQPGESAFVG